MTAATIWERFLFKQYFLDPKICGNYWRAVSNRERFQIESGYQWRMYGNLETPQSLLPNLVCNKNPVLCWAKLLCGRVRAMLSLQIFFPLFSSANTKINHILDGDNRTVRIRARHNISRIYKKRIQVEGYSQNLRLTKNVSINKKSTFLIQFSWYFTNITYPRGNYFDQVS